MTDTKSFKVLICGDRHYENERAVEMVVWGLWAQYGRDLIIINGGAPGADRLASKYAIQVIPAEDVHVYMADWTRYGKAAGPIRNTQMLEEKPDLVIAFHDDIQNSKGTLNMINQAHDKGVPVYIIGKYNGKE